jgi:GrpB-like predicted nucleotidyltransferase (UPF0157 family)
MTRRMTVEPYTSRVTSSPKPIGPYERRLASVYPWSPRYPAIAGRIAGIIHTVRPELEIEHIGSTAVPGLPGKGILDLGTETDPTEIPAIVDALYALGFGPQPGPNPWPPTRPMLVGSIVDEGEEYRIHVHIHPRGNGDLAKDLRFRDALRADLSLRDGYAGVKSDIAGPEGGPVDAVRYQAEKGVWILDVFDQLGIPRPVNVQGGPVGEAEDGDRSSAGGEGSPAVAPSGGPA